MKKKEVIPYTEVTEVIDRKESMTIDNLYTLKNSNDEDDESDNRFETMFGIKQKPSLA